MSPPPAIQTSQEELLGTTTGIILTVVVALVGLGMLIVPVFWAAGHPTTRRQRTQRRPENIPAAVPTGDPRSVTLHRGDNREGDAAGPAGDGAGGQGHWPSERLEDRYVPEGGNPHGKPSSWVLVAVVAAAFVTGGLAIISHIWWLLWACFGVVVLAAPAGVAIGIMDDTVAWGSNPAAGHGPFQDPEDGPRRDQPDHAQAPMRDHF